MSSLYSFFASKPVSTSRSTTKSFFFWRFSEIQYSCKSASDAWWKNSRIATSNPEQISEKMDRDSFKTGQDSWSLPSSVGSYETESKTMSGSLSGSISPPSTVVSISHPGRPQVNAPPPPSFFGRPRPVAARDLRSPNRRAIWPFTGPWYEPDWPFDAKKSVRDGPKVRKDSPGRADSPNSLTLTDRRSRLRCLRSFSNRISTISNANRIRTFSRRSSRVSTFLIGQSFFFRIGRWSWNTPIPRSWQVGWGWVYLFRMTKLFIFTKSRYFHSKKEQTGEDTKLKFWNIFMVRKLWVTGE